MTDSDLTNPKTRRATGRGAELGAGLLALAMAAVVLLGGTTIALWSVGLDLGKDHVAAGDMWIRAGGPDGSEEMTWRQVTPGAPPGASGSLATMPDGLLSMPGDVVEVSLPVATYLRGDNLAAAMTVDCVDAVTGDGITTTVRVEDEQGRVVAPAVPDDKPLVVPGLTGDGGGVTTRWTVVLRVEVTGDYRWVTPGTAATIVTWNVGTVHVTLDQQGGDGA